MGTVCGSARDTEEEAPKLIIFGPPASGKGTQCEFLKEKYPGIVHISTGDVLRTAVKDGTEIGKEAEQYMSRGELVPDELIKGLVVEKVRSEEAVKNGWLLDGYPRTKAQADALVSEGIISDKVIILNVPAEILVLRVTGRRMDPDTGKIYHLEFHPPPAEVADRVVQRDDDTEEKVKVRISAYEENLSDVKNAFGDVAFEVDGGQEKEKIFEDICVGLECASK